MNKRAILTEEHHAEGGGSPARGDFIAISFDGENVMVVQRPADGFFVAAEVDERAEFELNRILIGDEVISDVNGVLALEQNDAFFEDDAIDMIAPDGQLILETEFDEAVFLSGIG
jgi:hypothetical protein